MLSNYRNHKKMSQRNCAGQGNELLVQRLVAWCCPSHDTDNDTNNTVRLDIRDGPYLGPCAK